MLAVSKSWQNNGHKVKICCGIIINAPVKVNPGTPMNVTGVHLTIQGTLTTASLSNILTLQIYRSYKEGILTVNTNGRVEILTDKHFLCQKSLGKPVPPLPPGFTLTGA